MNTIDDMQNEKDFFYLCNMFEYNQDFEKIDDALLEFDVLNNNICLSLIGYYKFLLF